MQMKHWIKSLIPTEYLNQTRDGDDGDDDDDV